MNIILINDAELGADETVCLEGRRRDHIVDILGASIGDEVRVGVIDGPIGTGRLVHRDEDRVTLRITLGLVPSRPRVTMILAMVRPQIMKRTLQHLSMLGVRRILLVGARRVEPSYFGQRLFDGDEYREHLLLGLEQAVDTWVPDLSIHRRFRPFVEDLLPRIIDRVPTSRRIVAHPGSSSMPRGLGPEDPVALAVGPEGGWSDFEIEKFEVLGFRAVSLGHRTLKVETAVPYLFGALGLCEEVEAGVRPGKVSRDTGTM